MPAGRFVHPQETIDKVRRLHMLDPEIYTVKALSAQFRIPKGTISKWCNRRQRKQRIDILKDDGIHIRDEDFIRREVGKN